MRCAACNKLLTTREEIFNINQPFSDGKEFCTTCMGFIRPTLDLKEYADEVLSSSDDQGEDVWRKPDTN